MEDTAKYLVHADIVANGVVERSDVVGAIFGQTEGLLGDELDLRDLQRASKLGRINVEIDSENGQSFGQVTIASSLDRVETAILAAALETIDRVGPCRSTVAVSRIEDVRAAKRREVVARAQELLGEFDESVISTQELVEEVRRSVRVEDITEYKGLPAGPRVAKSDAIIVVEGRADVLTLLRYGIKNAVAVEGTNVPEPVADLTAERTTTAFLDGDRGGDLILKELGQVGKVDYVAIAPPGRSVEDLARREALMALRNKVSYEGVADATSLRESVAATDGSIAATDGSTWPAPPDDSETTGVEPAVESPGTSPDPTSVDGDGTGTSVERAVDSGTPAEPVGIDDAADPAGSSIAANTDGAITDSSAGTDTEPSGVDADANANAGADEPVDGDPNDGASSPNTLRGHVQAVTGTGRVRLLNGEFETLADAPGENAFDSIAEVETVPSTVVLDGELSQRVLDVAAQRGIERIVAREHGEFVKQPTSVRVQTATQLHSE